MAGVFLSTDWLQLAMLNYRVAPELLLPLLPAGTALDALQGATYVSIVGFMFRDTRVLGAPIPFHRTFEEVNLRMYVKHVADGAERRGVTFIRELVPRSAIAITARLAYNEPYRALPMAHRLGGDSVEYSWKPSAAWTRIRLAGLSAAALPSPGSEEEFITRRHWGYTRQRDGSTIEYEVRHPPWQIRSARNATLEGDLVGTYGDAFAEVVAQPPHSAFLADGSAVTVHWPRRIAG